MIVPTLIYLDTTVLVYAVGSDHPAREPCRWTIELCGSKTLSASTTSEVIQEFVHIRSRRRSRSDAVELGRQYARLLGPLAAVGEDELAEGLALFEHAAALGAFDAVLAATARRAKAQAIVSVDDGFRSLPDLRHLSPLDANFTADLLSLSPSG